MLFVASLCISDRVDHNQPLERNDLLFDILKPLHSEQSVRRNAIYALGGDKQQQVMTTSYLISFVGGTIAWR